MSEEKDGLLTKIESMALKGIDSIMENPSLMSAIFGIPKFGPAIYSGLGVLHSEIVAHRLQKLASLIREESLTIAESKLDESFMSGQEFHDILVRVMECTVKTQDELKIRLYARILTRVSLLDNARFRHNASHFLAILLELAPPDLVLAREIYKQQKDIADNFKNHAENEVSAVLKRGYRDLQKLTGLDDVGFAFALVKLNRAGLIRQINVPSKEYTGDLYRITPVFKTLMSLVEKLE